jgi:hypothetical protein
MSSYLRHQAFSYSKEGESFGVNCWNPNPTKHPQYLLTLFIAKYTKLIYFLN